jgi:alginate O-acetyltransferase complex protein AlgJ
MAQAQEATGAGVGGSRLNNGLAIALFMILLITPAVAQLFGFTSGIAGENRYLAPFPKLNVRQDLKLLPRMLEDYVNDRFGLRSQMVHVNSLMRFKLGLSSTKDIVIGRDQWLFYTADKIMEQHTGADIFTPTELEHWVRLMEAYRDWLAARNIAFYILIAPEKNTIYPEKVPDYPRSAITRIDQLAERLRNSNLEFIDPREQLFESKAAGETIYFAGDTHWTERGAFVAYRMLMDEVRKSFPSVAPLTISNFDISYSAPPTADLAVHLHLEKDLHYFIERLTPKWRLHQTAPQTTTYRPGWGWRITENKNDLYNQPRLLVFGDSFTDYVLGPHMLYETFRDPLSTHNNGGTLNMRLVEELKPDIVLVQFAERYLHLVPLKLFDDVDLPMSRSS